MRDEGVQTVSLYRNGPFTDLCRGPHGATTTRIKAFKLFITTHQEVVQAERLVTQCSNRGASTGTRPAASFANLRIHSSQAH